MIPWLGTINHCCIRRELLSGVKSAMAVLWTVSVLAGYAPAMCNRYGYQQPLSAIPDEFSDLGPIRWDGLEPNAPLDQISRPIARRSSAPLMAR